MNRVADGIYTQDLIALLTAALLKHGNRLVLMGPDTTGGYRRLKAAEILGEQSDCIYLLNDRSAAGTGSEVYELD